MAILPPEFVLSAPSFSRTLRQGEDFEFSGRALRRLERDHPRRLKAWARTCGNSTKGGLAGQVPVARSTLAAPGRLADGV